jgi:hypothetical protein
MRSGSQAAKDTRSIARMNPNKILNVAFFRAALFTSGTAFAGPRDCFNSIAQESEGIPYLDSGSRCLSLSRLFGQDDRALLLPREGDQQN